ncbi:uncharacterized protein LDX57_003783 [Aspergillus melleus]|uniref:uncharacterized protein n=1 Tax=Aspergillus melleus TaxID=138277 RepID=UPI001E8E71E2|nr:uncharacterized protein LDX57_003783 [Aspergillus melleus]KAH8426043.1 hypothetical protein LDX57_003783 [Aspergillus melleus]
MVSHVPIYINSPTIPPTPKPTHLISLPLVLLLPPTLLFLLHTIRKDYHAFLALGPGGTPSTPTGYLRICILRLIALRNPFSPPSIPSTLSPKTGYFDPCPPTSPSYTSPSAPTSQNNARDTPNQDETRPERTKTHLPYRRGPPPLVTGIAPQRQLTQRSTKLIYTRLAQAIEDLVRANPKKYVLGTSCFEKHSTGIFASPCTTATTAPSASSTSSPPTPSMGGKHRRNTCNGEICHSHPIDGSLHLTLHPADVRVLIERGWGQRHPLAWEEETSRRWLCGTRFVPAGFVMVYAPRDEDEVRVVMEVVRAAGWWVSGES